MPYYQFECRECHHITDSVRSIDRRDDLIACEECGQASERVQSLPQPAIIRFKPGYYDTVGSHCDTEAEFFNKRDRATQKIIGE